MKQEEFCPMHTQNTSSYSPSSEVPNCTKFMVLLMNVENGPSVEKLKKKRHSSALAIAPPAVERDRKKKKLKGFLLYRGSLADASMRHPNGRTKTKKKRDNKWPGSLYSYLSLRSSNRDDRP